MADGKRDRNSVRLDYRFIVDRGVVGVLADGPKYVHPLRVQKTRGHWLLEFDGTFWLRSHATPENC